MEEEKIDYIKSYPLTKTRKKRIKEAKNLGINIRLSDFSTREIKTIIDYFIVSPYITEDFIESKINKLNWKKLSKKENLSLDFIEKNIDKPWNWNYLTSKVTFDFIEKHIDKPWDWYYITFNLSNKASLHFIEKYIDKDWDWYGYYMKDGGLSSNSNITLEFIEKHIDKHWDWNKLSKNPNITSEFIEKYINKNWCWYELSKNSNIILEIMEKINLKDKYWNLNSLATNPNLTYEFIEKYIYIFDSEVIWDEINKNIGIDYKFIHRNKSNIKNIYPIINMAVYNGFQKEKLVKLVLDILPKFNKNISKLLIDFIKY